MKKEKRKNIIKINFYPPLPFKISVYLIIKNNYYITLMNRYS